MPSNITRPVPLQRTTSRTRTARTPLTTEAMLVVGVPQIFPILYAGPVDETRFPSGESRLPGVSANYPSLNALQVFAFDPSQGRQEVEARSPDPGVALCIDLGESRDIARIELYGNLLLPPQSAPTGPLFNFGLPRSVGVAIAEEPHFYFDLHRSLQVDAWLADRSSPFHSRFEARDFRSLWGWTPIHLQPTYGRFLVLFFSDLPLVFNPFNKGEIGRGIDIQRLVVYPFLDDVDHHPMVEHALVSARQTQFSSPAQASYWNYVGENAPAPATHESVTLFSDSLPWPSVLSGLPISSPSLEWSYQSEVVRLDSDERVVLTFTATSDEIPILEAMRFIHVDNRDTKDNPGVARDDEVMYYIDLYCTNEEEAAWSPDLTHPSWRLVRAGASYPAVARFFSVDFVEPVRARFVRAVFSLRKRDDADPSSTHGRVRMSFVTLARCRDFILAPEPDEELHVDTVLFRFHGKGLSDDYAFINGTDGFSLTVESRIAGGPFQEIRRLRNLLDIIENTAARPVINPRSIDKPIQRYREHVEATQTGDSRTDTLASEATNNTSLPPGTQNVTVSRTGSVTRHVKNAKNRLLALGDPNVTSFPDVDTDGVKTRRRYEDSTFTLPDPSSVQDAESLMSFMGDLLAAPDTAPIPLNFGVAVSGSLGVQVGAGGSIGGSLSVGGSVGGGNTRSIVRGNQASVGESQTTTLFTESHQTISSTGFSEQRRSSNSIDDRAVRREDYSDEVRKTGVAVKYGGKYEDILLVAIPVKRLLSGRSYIQGAADEPPIIGDTLRVRLDHVPEGVRVDVEFRGTAIPIREP